jgi:hypothetical protein
LGTELSARRRKFGNPTGIGENLDFERYFKKAAKFEQMGLGPNFFTKYM